MFIRNIVTLPTIAIFVFVYDLPRGAVALPGKPAKFTDADVKIAEEKFNDSFKLAETSMANLLDNDVEQVAQLSSFVQASGGVKLVGFRLQSLKSY